MQTEYLYYNSGERSDIDGKLLRLKIINRFWLDNLEVVLAELNPPLLIWAEQKIIFAPHFEGMEIGDLFNGKEKWIVARLFEAPFIPETQEELVTKLRHLDNGMLALQKEEIEKIINDNEN